MSANAPLKKLMVIINPAAGVDRPILGLLNAAMNQAGIEWEVRVTHQANDARQLAKEAAQAGWDMVAAHGGDGTVAEVADGLRALQNQHLVESLIVAAGLPPLLVVILDV